MSAASARPTAGRSLARFLERHALRLRVRLSHWSLDTMLAAGLDPASDPAFALRAAQLRSRRHRQRLASWLEQLARDSEAARSSGLTSAAPLVTEQVDESRDSLLLVARLLRGPEPVRPRGVAMIERLLRDGESVLYAETARGAVELHLRAAIDCLVGSPIEAASISASATPPGRPRLTQTA
jgi:hypothetical protein